MHVGRGVSDIPATDREPSPVERDEAKGICDEHRNMADSFSLNATFGV